MANEYNSPYVEGSIFDQVAEARSGNDSAVDPGSPGYVGGEDISHSIFGLPFGTEDIGRFVLGGAIGAASMGMGAVPGALLGLGVNQAIAYSQNPTQYGWSNLGRAALTTGLNLGVNQYINPVGQAVKAVGSTNPLVNLGVSQVANMGKQGIINSVLSFLTGSVLGISQPKHYTIGNIGEDPYGASPTSGNYPSMGSKEDPFGASFSYAEPGTDLYNAGFQQSGTYANQPSSTGANPWGYSNPEDIVAYGDTGSGTGTGSGIGSGGADGTYMGDAWGDLL